jgi:hypothetical protein
MAVVVVVVVIIAIPTKINTGESPFLTLRGSTLNRGAASTTLRPRRMPGKIGWSSVL